jgi:hypothetical protein
VTRKNWRWGVSSLATAVAAFIYLGMVLHFCCYAFLAEPVNAPQERPLTEEDKIMALILSYNSDKPEDDCSYTIVSPETWSPYSTRDTIHLKEYFKERGYDFDNLVDRFFELNQEPVRLTLKSSPEEGYYIDYDGKFDGYGWFRLYLLRPHATGHTHISMPAYDAETGYVLVFLSYQNGLTDGAGFTIVFKYEGGQLTEIGSILLWLS